MDDLIVISAEQDTVRSKDVTVGSEATTDERQRSPNKWLPVSIAPPDVLLEVCVIDDRGVHPFMFPCCKSETEWVDPLSRNRMDMQPTHWRNLVPFENQSFQTDLSSVDDPSPPNVRHYYTRWVVYVIAVAFLVILLLATLNYLY